MALQSWKLFKVVIFMTLNKLLNPIGTSDIFVELSSEKISVCSLHQQIADQKIMRPVNEALGNLVTLILILFHHLSIRDWNFYKYHTLLVYLVRIFVAKSSIDQTGIKSILGNFQFIFEISTTFWIWVCLNFSNLIISVYAK